MYNLLPLIFALCVVPALAVILPAKIFLSYHLAVEAKKGQKLLKDKEGCQKPREKTKKRQNTEKVRKVPGKGVVILLMQSLIVGDFRR
jgi:uncharacterized membrane protein (DUF106 family)